MGPIDIGRRKAAFGGEGDQQMLIADDMIEHANQESRLGGGGANRAGVDTREREKARQPIGLRGDEAKGLNRHAFCAVTRSRMPLLHALLFAFPKGIPSSLAKSFTERIGSRRVRKTRG